MQFGLKKTTSSLVNRDRLLPLGETVPHHPKGSLCKPCSLRICQNISTRNEGIWLNTCNMYSAPMAQHHFQALLCIFSKFTYYCLFNHRTYSSLRVTYNEEAELSYSILMDYFKCSYKNYPSCQVLVKGRQSQAVDHKDDSLVILE